MNQTQDIINKLVRAFQRLPGIGGRSAKRIAIEILSHKKIEALQLSEQIETSVKSITQCAQCLGLATKNLCSICLDTSRESNILCIVHGYAALEQIEATKIFHGTYFVLSGLISPIDNVSTETIKISKLINLINDKDIKEIIYAVPASIESETTLYHIKHTIKNPNIKISHIAQGVPYGGNFDSLDSSTISNAIKWRQTQEIEL